MTERWLLYDAGCSICAALAREVKTLSGGRLGVRSLRDPEVRALLDRARPGWRWEPMLVEIEGERVRVFTGLAVRWRLVQVLGPEDPPPLGRIRIDGDSSKNEEGQTAFSSKNEEARGGRRD